MQTALLGMVVPSMQAVLVSWSESDVEIRILFDKYIAESEIEIASEIESEVMSHLPSHIVRCHAEVFSGYGNIEATDGEVFVFKRAN